MCTALPRVNRYKKHGNQKMPVTPAPTSVLIVETKPEKLDVESSGWLTSEDAFKRRCAYPPL